jgi:hypothetical protein
MSDASVRQYLGQRYSSKAKVRAVLKEMFPKVDYPDSYAIADEEFSVRV